MADLRFVPVTDDAGLDRLETALAALSTHLGDTHTPQRDRLRHALSGRSPAAHGLLALSAGVTQGAALFSPVYSTVRGAAGVFVSDLWVAQGARGQGIGRRLLIADAQAGGGLWGADWLKLAVYDHSIEAQGFYRRLGFVLADGMQEMRLEAGSLAALTGDNG